MRFIMIVVYGICTVTNRLKLAKKRKFEANFCKNAVTRYQGAIVMIFLLFFNRFLKFFRDLTQFEAD